MLRSISRSFWAGSRPCRRGSRLGRAPLPAGELAVGGAGAGPRWRRSRRRAGRSGAPGRATWPWLGAQADVEERAPGRRPGRRGPRRAVAGAVRGRGLVAPASSASRRQISKVRESSSAWSWASWDLDLGGVEEGDDLALPHAVAVLDGEGAQDAAFEVLDGLALALGVEDAVGDDGAVEAGEHAPAEERRRQAGDEQHRGDEDRAVALQRLVGGGERGHRPASRSGRAATRAPRRAGGGGARVARTSGRGPNWVTAPSLRTRRRSAR